jgi:hypothetical protein
MKDRPRCPEYRPDHNGECLTCDEPAFAHDLAALRPEYYADRLLAERQRLDAVLSDTQRYLRDGHTDHERMCDAVAEARNLLRVDDVAYTAIRVTIEKIAADISRELLQDAAFKTSLKALAVESLKRTFRGLDAPRCRPKNASKRRG